MPCYSTHYILIEYAMKINEEYIISPGLQVTQKFAEGAVSVPQFKQNVFHSSNAAMLDLPPAQHSLREPWVPGFHPPRSVTCICFCREFLPLL